MALYESGDLEYVGSGGFSYNITQVSDETKRVGV